MKITHNDKDITQFLSSVTLGGSAYQAARCLQMSILNDISVKLGDRIVAYDDGKKLIDASVNSRERSGQGETYTITAYDDSNILLKSKAKYVFKNTTPEEITKKICRDFNVSIGIIAKTNHHIKKLICDGDSPYDIIIKAYKKADGKFQIIMSGRKLNVIKKGDFCGVVLDDSYNITDSTFSQSLEEMVNKVDVYNEKGKKIREVKNKSDIEKYGIYQDVTTDEPQLHGVSDDASVTGINGDIRAISGYAIKVYDKKSGLSGKYWIESDTHTWEGGIHTMDLNLSFKNIMGDDD